MLATQILLNVRSPEAFFTIVWTIVTHLHKNSKNAKLRRVIEIFEVSMHAFSFESTF